MKLAQQRVFFTKDADMRLRLLKGKMGVTPNVICRIGFCRSLNVATEPPAVDEKERARDINRYTLFGEYDLLFTALLVQWKHSFGSDLGLDELCLRHMNRGVYLVSG